MSKKYYALITRKKNFCQKTDKIVLTKKTHGGQIKICKNRYSSYGV